MKVRNKELNNYGISGIASGVLFLVHAMDNKITPADIAKQMLQEPNAISRLVSRMEKAGFLRKVKDLNKKNQVRIELTEKGLITYQKSIKRESLHNIMSVLSDEEMDQLSDYLKKIRTAALKEFRQM